MHERGVEPAARSARRTVRDFASIAFCSSRSTSSMSVAAVRGGDPHRQRAGEIHGAGIDRRARGDFPPRGLAGDQALVDLGGAGDDHAVGRRSRSPGRTRSRSPGFTAAGRHAHHLAAVLKPMRESALQRRQVGRRLRASCAASRGRDSAPAQQEEQQHGRRNRNRHARRCIAVSTTDMPSARITPSEIGTSMLRWRARIARQRALKERLARISGGRQRDERGQPVEEVARLRRHVETLPDHTDTDSSMMFMAAKPATARHLISQRACLRLIRFGALGLERMRPVADPLAARRSPRRHRARRRANRRRDADW